jgi:hypothetical protein
MACGISAACRGPLAERQKCKFWDCNLFSLHCSYLLRDDTNANHDFYCHLLYPALFSFVTSFLFVHCTVCIKGAYGEGYICLCAYFMSAIVGFWWNFVWMFCHLKVTPSL